MRTNNDTKITIKNQSFFYRKTFTMMNRDKVEMECASSDSSDEADTEEEDDDSSEEEEEEEDDEEDEEEEDKDNEDYDNHDINDDDQSYSSVNSCESGCNGATSSSATRKSTTRTSSHSSSSSSYQCVLTKQSSFERFLDEEAEEDQRQSSNSSSEETVVDASTTSNSATITTPTSHSLNDLKIIKTIGTGTFGRVCLCRYKNTEKFVAMKIMSIVDIIRLKQVEHVKNEKNILCDIQHPFIVNLLWYTSNDVFLFMVFDYVSGGELFSYLRNAERFSAETSRFYSAEIIVALEYLHARNIVYRDLKPENLLLDKTGHLKITDFGFAKQLNDCTWTLCGTPEYLAPEIIQSKGHNKAVDWWALGVLIYEMLMGHPPFYDSNPFGIYEKILSGRIEWNQTYMEKTVRDLVRKLLVPDRTKRLGNMKNGVDDIKKHRWFKGIRWKDVALRKLKPPLVPDVSGDGDSSNFDEYPEIDWKSIRKPTEEQIRLFDDF